jgi:hypothetical protein
MEESVMENKRLVGTGLAIVLLGIVLGITGTSQASTGVVQVVIAGALASPTASTSDSEITLQLGVGLPVSLVSSGAVVPGSAGTATFALWSDSTPSAGLGPVTRLMVFRLGGGVMIVAGGITTPGGLVTTFSATQPFETLSGTWTVTGGAGSGVAGAGASDAVVTFTFDTNPSNTVNGFVPFVAGGWISSLLAKPVSGLATLQVARNVPVFAIIDNVVGPKAGTLTTYTVIDVIGPVSESAELSAIDFGGVFVLYACAAPDSSTDLACPIGGSGSASHLSGRISRSAGQFVTDITGVNDSDLVITIIGSLP